MRATFSVLLVEDDDIDILSINRAFKELGIANPLSVQKNGEDALHYLKDPTTDLPGLILLDLNMPKVGGIEFLKEIKKVDELRLIPTVILTTSTNHQDIWLAYENQAAGYVVKPLDFDEFKNVTKNIFEYWSLCELPELK